MRRFDPSNAIALAVSVLLHGSVLYVCSEVAHRTPVNHLGFGPTQARPVRTQILVDSPSTPEQSPAPLPDPAPKPPEALPEPVAEPELADLHKLRPRPIIPPELTPDEKPLAIPTDGFGELSGAPDATALHSLTGDRPMQARKAEQDQPYISRDPSGVSPPPEKPAPAAIAHAEGPRESPESAAPPKRREAEVQGVAKLPPVLARVENDPALLGRHPVSTTLPAEMPQPVTLALAQPLPPKREPAQEAPHNSINTPESKASPPGVASTSIAADPAPKTDSESDPFSTQGSAEFRPGKVIARFGRKVKTVRPRLSLAGQYALMSVASPDVVMSVRTDETGKVREVKIIRSSGSTEVDQPCQLAMYEWWFEPPRDASGQRQPAEMVWTISFRAH